MAFVSEVVAKMRVDKSGVDQELTAVTASFAKAGDAIDKQLSKGFGFRKLAKGFLQGIGIGSTSDIKDAITKPFEEAAKAAKEIEESTARTLKNYQELFSSRRTDEQNLAANRREQANLQKELAELNRARTEQFQVGFDPFTGKPLMEQRTRERTREEGKRADEIADRLSELSKEEFGLKDKIAKAQKTEDDRRMKSAQEFADKEEALGQKQEDFLRSQMSLEDQLADIERERIDLAERMANSDEDTIDLQTRELELLKEIARIEKQISTEAERQGKEYRNRAKEVIKASDAVTKARQDYATELRDRSASTLGEVASQRGNTSARVTARNIQKLEEQARRVRLMGGDFRDPNGKIVSREEYADKLIQRADKMRAGLGMLSSKEKDPMAAAAADIKRSTELLENIDGYLQPSEIR